MEDFMETAVCSRCDEEKSVLDFPRRSNRPRGIAYHCKACDIKKVRNWAKNNPDKIYERFIKKLYKLTLNEYNNMLEIQSHKCVICAKKHNPTKNHGRLFVDHNHETGEIRGLLCGNCNSILGHAHDNIDVLYAAINYLAKYS